MSDRQPAPQPTMSPDEFRDAQRRLGLSDAELAHVLGISNPQHIRRLKSAEGLGHHKPVQPWHVRLLRAYLDGYRPDDWPQPSPRRSRIAHLPRDTDEPPPITGDDD